MRIISSASELSALLVPHVDCASGELAGVPLDKRAARLTPEEIQALHEWALQNVEAAIVMLTAETAKVFLGAEVIDPTSEPSVFHVGSKPATYYATRKNDHNRRFSDSRLGDPSKEGYIFDFLNGLWTLGDPGIIDATAKVQSLQHRCIARIKAEAIASEPIPTTPMVVIFNMPPQFGDNLDKAKERAPKDREYRDKTQFTDELIESVLSEIPDSSDLPKARATWAEMLVTCSNWVYCRINGVDVQASKSKLPTERERLAFGDRFERVANCDALQALIVRVWESSHTPDGKKATWTKYFTPAMVVTALVLASNADNEDPDNVIVNDGLVETVLQSLLESGDEGSTGFSPAFADLANVKKKIKSSGGGAPRANEIFGCLVTAMKAVIETGNAPAKVWHGATDRKREKAKGNYRCFGGLDSGAKDDSDE